MLEEFKNQIPDLINSAIEVGATCPIEKIELKVDLKYLSNLDRLVEIIKADTQKEKFDKEIVWNTSVCLGTLLGEMIIKKHRLHWTINSEDIPVVETDAKKQLSPITKIYKILKSKDDIEGSPSSFYNGYLNLLKLEKMSKEELDSITTYI